ncbi:MAG: InlB B-repeat-containing protein, partial [Treponema sp.]|nr:InlB B-repeat-containing protein [Treponema sp.]
MMMRKPCLLIVIAAILGVFSACDDLNKPTPEYTVNFFANGGSPAPQSQTIIQGEKVTEPAAMTKAGYVFGGWYMEAAYTNQWNFATNVILDNISLYAKWDTIYFIVSFNAGGGSPVPAQQMIAYGDKVPQPAYMTKTNYGFGGWYKEAACINQWNFTINTVIGNITLYAKWDSNYYTVSFNANGGSPAPAQQNIAYNGKVSEPPDLSKTGYTFGGWYKEATCINLWDFDTDTVTGNITLYAKWIENFTVTFDANGGTPAQVQQSIASGGKASKPDGIIKQGYAIEGWYKEEALINQWDFDTDTVTENIILYTKWIEAFTVTFNADGGNPAPSQQSIAHGGKVTEPSVMSKTGYTFGGWYKEAAHTNQWAFNTDTVTGNITLYAKWINNINYYTVSFNADGGSPAPGQQSITHGGKVTQPTAMSKSGYTFGGWYKEATFINLWNFNSDTVTQNIVLYAKWGLVPPTTVQGTNLVEKLKWLNSNAQSNTNYLLEVNRDELLGPNTLSYSGKSNITIRLIGIGSTRVIDLYNSGSFFTIESGVTLILDENIVLKGKTDNSVSLVRVNGGNLIMNNGSKITGNTASSPIAPSYGGGVYVNNGTFTMNGGEISGNTALGGGGVYVRYPGTFTMNGGKISGNTALGGGGV